MVLLDLPTHDNSLVPDPKSIRSAIQVVTEQPLSACEAILERLNEVLLTIGTTFFAVPDRDGIYRDPEIHHDAFDVEAGNQPVPPGFVISVDLGGATHAAVTRADGSHHAVVAQRDEGNRFVMFFNEGLASGEHLTIEPKS